MASFTAGQLGAAFAEPQPGSLADAFADSSAASPVVLMVQQGAGALSELCAFAAEQGRAVGRGLQLLSLGQGQGPVAEALVHLAMASGDWVCLQVMWGGGASFV
jgi:dynein heavy chain